MTNGLLRLEDHEFLADPEKNKDAVVDALCDADDLGLKLDAPLRVSPDEDGQLPVAFLFIRTLADDAKLDPERQLVTVAVREDDNQLWVGTPLLSGKTAGDGIVGFSFPGLEGLRVSLDVEDIRTPLGLDWRRSGILTTGLLREMVSNTVKTMIAPTNAEFRDDAVEAYIEQRTRTSEVATPPRVDPPLPEVGTAIQRALDGGPSPFPNYREQPESPAMPEGIGVALSIDRVAELGRGRRCMLRGSFRLPATKHERVGFDPQTGRLLDVGVSGATAVVTIHLVATGTKAVGPFVMTLKVPSYDPVDPNAASLVTGHFNLDLFEHEEGPSFPDTYFFTAFSRDVVVGPIQVGIVGDLGE
ncbi:MAG: hypothetical protein AAGA54_10355 [Myxococcota bacterium]